MYKINLKDKLNVMKYINMWYFFGYYSGSSW